MVNTWSRSRVNHSLGFCVWFTRVTGQIMWPNAPKQVIITFDTISFCWLLGLSQLVSRTCGGHMVLQSATWQCAIVETGQTSLCVAICQHGHGVAWLQRPQRRIWKYYKILLNLLCRPRYDCNRIYQIWVTLTIFEKFLIDLICLAMCGNAWTNKQAWNIAKLPIYLVQASTNRVCQCCKIVNIRHLDTPYCTHTPITTHHLFVLRLRLMKGYWNVCRDLCCSWDFPEKK